jgi:hypothetical protein
VERTGAGGGHEHPTQDAAVSEHAIGGRDGVIAVTWWVVVRSGDTLVLVSYPTEQQIGSGPTGDGDGGAGARSTAEALARAALDRFAAAT